jgi:transcriptional regulator with XRE-family HTH domain
VIIDRIKLRELRRSRKLTGKKLADMVGVGNRYISEIENGVNKPSQSLILRLAKALDAEPSAICIEEPNADSVRARAMELSGDDPLVLRAVDLLLELSEPERFRQLGAIADAVEAEKRKSTPDAEIRSSAAERKIDVSSKKRP